MTAIAFTIYGQAASKANSRKLVTRPFRGDDGQMHRRPMSIKSDAAREFERAALLQIPVTARVELTGPVRVTMRLYYASERPDLDESIVLDVMQSRYCTRMVKGRETKYCLRKGVYLNDRQVREKHIYHAIDRANPRAEVMVEPLTAQQDALDLDEIAEVAHD
jgi:Holliday junction resolvase RusA-like endonuclease